MTQSGPSPPDRGPLEPRLFGGHDLLHALQVDLPSDMPLLAEALFIE